MRAHHGRKKKKKILPRLPVVKKLLDFVAKCNFSDLRSLNVSLFSPFRVFAYEMNTSKHRLFCAT